MLDLEAELRTHRSVPGAEAAARAAGVAAPELQALNDEMTRRHWISWLDERVPALGRNDLWIAALCVEPHVPLATADAHFDAIDDLMRCASSRTAPSPMRRS